MAEHSIDSPTTYDEGLRRIEVSDAVHADTLNPIFSQLINNDAYLNENIRTNEEIEDVIGGLISAGSNVNVDYNDNDNTLTISASDSDTQLSNEEVEDIVNGLLTEGDNVDLTYDDEGNTLEISVNNNGIVSEINKNPPMTFNTPTVKLSDSDELNLARFDIPNGKSLKIIQAGLIQMDGTTGTAGLELQVYNVTDSSSIYTTTSNYADGSYSSPLASGATGDEIIIRISNTTGSEVNVSGFCAVVID